jgi:hypothetical protein
LWWCWGACCCFAVSGSTVTCFSCDHHSLVKLRTSWTLWWCWEVRVAVLPWVDRPLLVSPVANTPWWCYAQAGRCGGAGGHEFLSRKFACGYVYKEEPGRQRKSVICKETSLFGTALGYRTLVPQYPHIPQNSCTTTMNGGESLGNYWGPGGCVCRDGQNRYMYTV